MKTTKIFRSTLVSLFVGLFFAFMSGCSGGGGDVAATTDGTMSGAAVKGPVAGAQVQAFAINANGAKGSMIGTATTAVDGTGDFTMNVGSYAGPVLLEMTGGTFMDEAAGTQMTFAGADVMTALVPFMTKGATMTNVEITPLTAMAQTMAANMTGGMSQANAVTANTAVGTLYSVSDILQTKPMDPTLTGTGATATIDQRNYGLCLAAISQSAVDLGLSDSVAMVTGMMSDATDGVMDGMHSGVQVVLAPHMGSSIDMPANAGSAGMVMAMRDFLGSGMNNSGVTEADPGMTTMIDKMNSSAGHMVGTMSGMAVKGPVAGAQVQAFAIAANGTKGNLIGTAMTSSVGVFTMTMASYEGPVLLEMTGGTFVDEASGTRMGFSGTDMMTAVVPFMTAGTMMTDVEITPLTSMAQTMAATMTGGMSHANADAANMAVGNFYDVSDILMTRPMDPLVNNSGDTATIDERNYGLCLAAMSQYADTIGLTDASALVTGMMGDAADGFMDGMHSGTSMMLGSHMNGGGMGGGMTMPTNAGSVGMADAMQTYLDSAMNLSGVTASEMQAYMQQLGSANGHLL